MASDYSERRVVITGLGAVTPLGNDVETLWQGLLAGQCGIDRITHFDASPFDTQIAGEVKNFDPGTSFPSPKDARRADRFAQFGVFAAHQALLDSGLDLERTDRDQVGAFIGSGIGGLKTTEDQHSILLSKGPSRLSPFMIPMLILNMASGFFSMFYKLRGPNVATYMADVYQLPPRRNR